MTSKYFLQVSVIIFILAFSLKPGTAIAQTQEGCQSELRLAEALYREAKHDSALSLLNGCLSREPEREERVAAYKLLGKANVALGNIKAAKEAFLEMLQLVPLATLDSKQEGPEVIRIFEEVKFEFFTANESPAASKNWPWIAIAGAVVATIGALLVLK